jgi:hypothetical protein
MQELHPLSAPLWTLGLTLEACVEKPHVLSLNVLALQLSASASSFPECLLWSTQISKWKNLSLHRIRRCRASWPRQISLLSLRGLLRPHHYCCGALGSASTACCMLPNTTNCHATENQFPKVLARGRTELSRRTQNKLICTEGECIWGGPLGTVSASQLQSCFKTSVL